MKLKFVSALLVSAALIAPGITRAVENTAPDSDAAAVPVDLATTEPIRGIKMQEGLQTEWEALWHQSGTPTRLVRWEGDLYVRITGQNVAKQRPVALKALAAVTHEAGLKLYDVTDRPELPANVNIEIVPNTALEDVQPCVTVLSFRSETRIDGANMQMRDKDVWRCAHHESMHVMGVRGHPSGPTVLSYFPVKVDALLPLDRAMLRAWYSPHMRGGMTPLEAMPVLAEELVKTQPDETVAQQESDQFLGRILNEAEAFAGGQGDIPQIVRRSGKATADGVRFGRAEMSYFLGLAFLQGSLVPADRGQAVQWLERAASAGNPHAQAELGAFR